MNPPLTRAERFAPYVTGILFSIPVLIVKYPPMSDTPLHEASIGLLRHWQDPHFAPRGLYYLNLGHANQLFSIAVWALSFIVPLTWATKLIVAATVFAMPVGAARFADYLRSPRWTALLVAPLALGWFFFWGLVQNMIGLTLLLVLFPAIDRFAAKPTSKGAAGICAAMLLMHFAHEAMQLVALLALVLFSIGTGKPSLRAVGLRAIPVFFCAAIVTAANRYSWYLSGPHLILSPLFTFYPLDHKFTTFSGVLFGGYDPYVRNLMLAAATAPVLLLLVERVRNRERGLRSLAEKFHAWRFEFLVLVLVGIYFVAPANFHGTTLVYHRFLPTAWAIFVVCAGAGIGSGLRPPVRLLCGALPIATLLVAWPLFADSHRCYSDLEPLIDRIEVGSSLATLNLGPRAQYPLWSPTDAMGHIVALRGGRSLFDYTLSPISPVTQRADKQWTNFVTRLDGNPFDLRPAWDLTRFRYLLIYTTNPGLAEVVTMAIKDEARPVAHSGVWYMFESRLPRVAFDSDDAPALPEPHPATLRKKLRELAVQLDSTTFAPAEAHDQRE
jgi:heme exporter protein D